MHRLGVWALAAPPFFPLTHGQAYILHDRYGQIPQKEILTKEVSVDSKQIR